MASQNKLWRLGRLYCAIPDPDRVLVWNGVNAWVEVLDRPKTKFKATR